MTLGLNDQLTGFASAAVGSLNSLNNLDTSIQSTTELTGGLGSTIKVATDSLEKANSQLKNLSGSVATTNTEISNLSNSTNSFNIAAAAQFKAANEHIIQSNKFIENYQNILNSVDRQQQLLGELESKLNSLIGNVSNLSRNSLNK